MGANQIFDDKVGFKSNKASKNREKDGFKSAKIACEFLPKNSVLEWG
jgi:hypothetical protein